MQPSSLGDNEGIPFWTEKNVYVKIEEREGSRTSTTWKLLSLTVLSNQII
jgi:hypothetical protein